MNKTKMLALALLTAGLGGAASAQDCAIDKDPWELSGDEITAVYACISDALAAGYAAGDNPVAAEYRGWTATATRPGLHGAHSERLLLTFANDIGAEAYMRYEVSDTVTMPVGTILAKESFGFRDTGAVRRGPLFIMEKVAAGEADDYDNWVYSGVQPNGAPLNISQAFCHDCHAAYSDQDSLGYPLEDIRITN